MTKTPATSAHVSIKPPDLKVAVFNIRGTAPLVIHRFSAKTKEQMAQKMAEGKSASSKKDRKPQNSDDTFNEGRYIASDTKRGGKLIEKGGWDGFHAASVRNAMISACRLVGFKMTLAKMSIFVLADGWDAKEPQIPLVRIRGTEAIKQSDMARVETGQPYVTYRPAYHNWSARIQIRYDAEQFNLQDVSNLLMRVGMQVGIGEGRPDSKNSCGMGWGLFEIEGFHEKEKGPEEKAA